MDGGRKLIRIVERYDAVLPVPATVTQAVAPKRQGTLLF